MRYFINKMLIDPDFQEATMRILKFAKGRDVLHPLRVEFEQNELLATFYKELYEWMMQNIQYVHDAIGSEYVRNPMRSLYLASGDCDCMVTLYLSFYMKLCSMVGIKGTHFRVMLASDTKTPTHVFAMLLIGGSWYGVDITNKKAAFGWFPDFKNYWVALDSTENLFPNPITHKFSKIKLRKISLTKPVK